jgi:DNA-binding Xre family transcriptional regulator
MTSYKPLWHLLIEKGMTKAELRKATGISPNTMTKLTKNEDVSMSVINKICATLDVSYGDIIEYIPDKENQ